MKRIINILFVLIFSFGITAYAQNSSVEIISRKLDVKSSELTILVNVTAPRGEVPLVMSVEKDGEFIAVDDGVTGDMNEDGVSEFTFDDFVFTDFFESGEYKFTISAEFINKYVSFKLSYLTNDEWLSVLSGINSGVASADASGVETLIANNVNATDISSDFYEDLSPQAKRLITKAVMKYTYSLPEKVETDADIEKLSTAIEKFKDACNEGAVYAELYSAQTTADFKKWWNKYDTELGLSTDNSQTVVDESKIISDYFESGIQKQEFLKRLSKCAGVLDNSKLQAEILEAIMLAKIETSNAQVVGGMVSKYSSYMGIEKVGTSAQSSVASGKVCGKDYKDMDDFAKDYENELPKGSVNTGSNNTGGGGGGGGGGGSSVSSSVVQDLAANTTNVKNDLSIVEFPFNDMQEFEWAQEAVAFLYKRSVVSGRDKTTFDPAASVTRAEFIKMLVVAYGLDAKVTDPLDFADVPADAWYGEFLRQAVKVGLVKGDNRNCFNPDATLTREDMAVMVQRASLFEKGSKEINFTDKNEISEYAYDAIEILYNKSVVSGMGDGRFAPKEAVTRAQAAQILYNVLINTYK